MRTFTTIKVGYSAGVYGCSGEYFTTIILEDNKQTSLSFVGLYGVEERINRKLKDLGYTEFYTPSRYRKLTGEDKKGFMNESKALLELDRLQEMFCEIERSK